MSFNQIWANLAVSDLKRTEQFYTDLGCKLNGKPTPELVSFLFSKNNFVIHFFRRDKLALAMNGKIADSVSGSEIMFSLSADSEDEVNSWAQKAEKAGGTIITTAGRQRTDFIIVYSQTRTVINLMHSLLKRNVAIAINFCQMPVRQLLQWM